MAESVVEEETHASNVNPSFSSEFDSIAIPNFYNSVSHQAPLENSIPDLRFLIDGDGDFELTFDSVDDLYFPSENESFVIPVDAMSREMSGDFTPGSGISGGCVDVKNENGMLSTSGCFNYESPRDSDCSGTAQSLSDVSEATIASSSPESGKMVVEQKFKLEEEATTTSITKRKKEVEEEDTSEESRSNKYRRSDEDGAASGVTGGEEDDQKRNTRLIRNRESAQLSRQRKKQYVGELEQKVRNMQSTITDLNSKISYFRAENVTLRQQVSPGSGMCRPPSSGMYPPMPYPWMPCPAYMVKPQGSLVPLLPIPRLKPQQPVVKVKKLSSKRSESKTKKVASVSVLGLLLCLFLFGALAPIVNVSYGGISSSAFYGEDESNCVTDRVYAQSRGRILNSDQEVGRNVSAIDNSPVPPGNGSVPLVASLFVPRNEKLVKIDGNLIIHSILASEKAMSSETESKGKTGLAITKGSSPALPLPDSKRNEDISSEKQKVLSKTASGKMQQWFREGVAGPMFSSGMCTEVFQFDVSSTSKPIIPASQHPKNTTDTYKGKKNRRILRGGLPISDFNLTKDQNSSSNKNFGENKPGPSMVVSVLVDPREGGDGEMNEMMGGPKSLSKVFIVVLVDSVKYVTYSCVLPRPEVPHLVTS